jgi:starch phosphorylase
MMKIIIKEPLMSNIFASKESFKEAFINEMNQMYQLNPNDASIFQRYTVLAGMVNQALEQDYQQTIQQVEKKQMKKTIYFSMEFLMGRLITNNLQNAGFYPIVKEVFDDLGLDINEVEHAESDAGLGNGGLGRLAACFLDSAASLGLPLYGNSLRYQHGFFTQTIVNHRQVEHPDGWLDTPFLWETKNEHDAIQIPVFGYVEHTKLVHPQWIKAIPYDVKIVGDQNGVVTNLRLWQTVESEKQTVKSNSYLEMVSSITDSLYPDDSTEDGKTLRLLQSYVFSTAGVQSAMREHKRMGRDVRDFHKYYTFQINDTHPTLVIPEMMRILMDNEGIGYSDAWHITTMTCAFTNHTILSEALEKWDIRVFRNLLPRIYEIVQEMNRRFRFILESDGRFNKEQIYLMSLIGQNHVRMAHICIYGSFSVNGVAALHTNILKNIEMKHFYQLYPNKFNNKTNGVTHRRWLIHTNPELSSILDEKIGTGWRKDLLQISDFNKFISDQDTKEKIDWMKRTKKIALANRIFELQGVKLDVDSIFDIQVKRLHEYKRQLMNILHIIYVYLRLKSDPTFKKNYYPHSFIFGAKAAPSYHMAKSVIELIDTVAQIINDDLETNEYLKVVFIRNYNVTYAEYIMPAADLSEQISTATKEASGTGNMKFMMNGAVTIGTMDGANVEIVEYAGETNAFIFGLTADQVSTIYQHNGYKPRQLYESDQRLQDVFLFIRQLNPNPQHFDYILNNLLNSDYFLVLSDFASYLEAHEKANEAYKHRSKWLEMSIANIANSGYFSSDRTIEQYNHEIWKLDKISF